MKTRWYGLIIEDSERKDFIGTILTIGDEDDDFLLVKHFYDLDGNYCKKVFKKIPFEKVIKIFVELPILDSSINSQNSMILREFLKKYVPAREKFSPIFISEDCINTILNEITTSMVPEEDCEEEQFVPDYFEDEFPDWEEDEFPEEDD